MPLVWRKAIKQWIFLLLQEFSKLKRSWCHISLSQILEAQNSKLIFSSFLQQTSSNSQCLEATCPNLANWIQIAHSCLEEHTYLDFAISPALSHPLYASVSAKTPVTFTTSPEKIFKTNWSQSITISPTLPLSKKYLSISIHQVRPFHYKTQLLASVYLQIKSQKLKASPRIQHTAWVLPMSSAHHPQNTLSAMKCSSARAIPVTHRPSYL